MGDIGTPIRRIHVEPLTQPEAPREPERPAPTREPAAPQPQTVPV